MPFSNAERQARFRERQKRAVATGGRLTPEQTRARDAVMAEPLYPVPGRHARADLPRFMGWERYEWSAAPRELAEHFGMGEVWDGWAAETAALTAHMRWR